MNLAEKINNLQTLLAEVAERADIDLEKYMSKRGLSEADAHSIMGVESGTHKEMVIYGKLPEATEAYDFSTKEEAESFFKGLEAGIGWDAFHTPMTMEENDYGTIKDFDPDLYEEISAGLGFDPMDGSGSA